MNLCAANLSLLENGRDHRALRQRARFQDSVGRSSKAVLLLRDKPLQRWFRRLEAHLWQGKQLGARFLLPEVDFFNHGILYSFHIHSRESEACGAGALAASAPSLVVHTHGCLAVLQTKLETELITLLTGAQVQQRNLSNLRKKLNF